MKILTFLALFTSPVEESYVSVCDRDYSNLSLNTKVELSIGCSTVRDRQAYKEWRLLEIYEGDAIFLTK